MPVIDVTRVAGEIADDLFRNGFGEVAECLVLELADGRDGGWWCRGSVRDCIAKKLQAAITEAAEGAERDGGTRAADVFF